MVKMPEVSVVIVNTNTREYVRQCLASIRDNGDVDAEVIVIETPPGTAAGKCWASSPRSK